MSNGRSALLAAVLVLLASAARCATISQAKLSANWMQVTVEGVVTYLEPTECYIESTDRSGGIRVIGSTAGIGLGDSVAAVGMFAVVDGEPAVIDASINRNTNSGEIRPFGMPNRAVGGASKWSPLAICDYVSKKAPVPPCGWVWERNWVTACGANNTGLLVTTWGTVKSTYYSPTTGARWFYIDDGSSLVSDYGDTGVLVYSDTSVENGQFVSVTGVSSTELSLDDPSRLIRVVRTRGASDLRVQRPKPPVYPFSDDFSKPVLDYRWRNMARDQFSLTIVPGWLTLTPQPSWFYCDLIQDLAGDWHFAAKIRFEFSDDTAITRQEAGIAISCIPDQVLFNASKEAGQQPLVKVAGQDAGALAGDTCWFSARKSGNTITGSVGFDGHAFSHDFTAQVTEAYSLQLYARENCGWPPVTPAVPFVVHFDYFHAEADL